MRSFASVIDGLSLQWGRSDDGAEDDRTLAVLLALVVASMGPLR